MNKKEIKQEMMSFIQDNKEIFSKDWDYHTKIDGRDIGYWITEIAENNIDECEQEIAEAYICDNIDKWIENIKKEGEKND